MWYAKKKEEQRGTKRIEKEWDEEAEKEELKDRN